MPEQQFPEPTVRGLIVNAAGRLLLMRSHKWRDKWVVPGGHIELGERMDDALRRELREETSLEIHDIRLLLHQEFVYDDAFWERRHFIFFDFLCRTDEREVQLNSEAQAYRWVTVEEAFEMPIEPYTRRLIEAYVDTSGLPRAHLPSAT